MDLKMVLIVIVAMAAVTYIPRLLPFLLVSNRQIPKKLEKFLQLVPFTALGALIIPGAYYSIPNGPHAAVVGIAVTTLVSWKKGGMIIPVFAGIIAAFLILSFL